MCQSYHVASTNFADNFEKTTGFQEIVCTTGESASGTWYSALDVVFEAQHKDRKKANTYRESLQKSSLNHVTLSV